MVLSAIALSAVALLCGGMAFFSVCVAPLVFARLPPEWAGRFIRAIFPHYYLWVMGSAAAGAVALLPLRPVDALILAAIAAITLWLRQRLMPRINAFSDAAREGDAAAQIRFARAHRLSVLINVGQIVSAFFVLFRFA